MNNQVTEKAELQRKIELGQALQRLENNQDFHDVVMDTIIIKTLLKDSEALVTLDPALRQETLEKIISVNVLKSMLTQIKTDATEAYIEISGEVDDE